MGGAGGGRVVVRVWWAKINQNSVIEQAMTLDLYIFLAKYLISFQMYNNRTNVPYIYIINQLEFFWHFFKIILLAGVRNIVMFFKILNIVLHI